eukprot:gene5962-8216_t
MINFLFSITISLLAVCYSIMIQAGSKAESLLSRLTLQEKLSLMVGVYGTYVGKAQHSRFRATDTTGGEGSSTAWPSALTVAASWDEDLLYRWSSAMANEFKSKGANVFLGPGIGIARVPTAGRNFEYLCGEDHPVLGSVLVKNVVKGIQDHGIIANAKHFVNNEIEDDRMKVSANVDERVRFELYYPPFQAAIDAGVLSVMCSYNRINDVVYACQNNETLSHLRDTMGFKGWVVSDWTATKSTTNSIKAGLDQEMPVGVFYNSIELESKMIANGEVSIKDIDTSVSRIFYSMEKIGLFENPVTGDPTVNVTSDYHNKLAREFAAKSIIDHVGECIAVIGQQTTVAGGGSGHDVNGPYVITPSQAMETMLIGTKTAVYYNNVIAQTNACEGYDRANLSLDGNQDTLISSIAVVSSNVIVSLNVPGAVLMPWANQVSSAILVSWLPAWSRINQEKML